MILLPPVLDRELRIFARKRKYFVLRSLLALFAFGAVFHIELNQTTGRPAFLTMLAVGFFIAQFSGAWLTASSLIDERRQGTLALLFITPLRPVEIILTKLAGHLALALSLIMALIPAAGVMLLAGGVTGLDLLLSSLALVNLTFWSLAVGLVVASYSKGPGQPAFTALALLVASAVPPLAAARLVGAELPFVVDVLEIGSPSMLVPLALRIETAFGWPTFLCAMGVAHLQAWVMVALAGQQARRSITEPATAPRRGKVRECLHTLAQGGVERRRQLRRVLRGNPVEWLVLRNRMPAVLGWTLLGLLVVAELVQRLVFGATGWSTTVLLGWIGLQVFKLIMANAAIERGLSERTSGGMELLLTSPLGLGELKQGLSRGFDRQLLPPYLVAFFLGGLWLWVQCLAAPGRSFQSFNLEALAAAALWLWVGILGAIDLMAVSALGSAAALLHHRRSGACFETFLGCWVLPGIATAIWLFTGMAGWERNQGPSWLGIAVLGTIALLGSLAALAIGRAELHVALERFRRHSAWTGWKLRPAPSHRFGSGQARVLKPRSVPAPREAALLERR